MRPTIESIKAEVLKMDPNVGENSLEFQAACIMLSALAIGADEEKILKFTGFPKGVVDVVSSALRKNKIWKDKKTVAQWNDPENGGAAFWMDCAVACGFLRRA